MPRPADQAIGQIESASFFSCYAFCRDAADFLRVARDSPAVQRLEDLVLSDPDQARGLVARIGRLLEAESDRGVRHPFDHAVATYLYVLSATNAQALSEAVASVRESRLPNLWFAYLVAGSLGERLPSSSDVLTTSVRAPLVLGERTLDHA